MVTDLSERSLEEITGMFQSKEELLIALRDKHGQDFVSLSVLEKPTSEFMMRYFGTVVSELGIDTKEMTQPKEMQLSPHADMFRDILPYVQLFRIVLMVYPIPKYMRNFSLLSLMEPKPDDIFFVAVMDNFFDFFYQRMTDLLEPRLEELSALRDQVQQQLQHKAELQNHLSDVDAARSRRAVVQGKVEEQLAELVVKETEIQQQTEELDVEAAELERELKILRREVEDEKQRQQELEVQLEMQRRHEVLTQKLQKLHEEHKEQEQVLAQKSVVRREKASRRRFLEGCLALEDQAMQGCGELLTLASEIEKRQMASQRSKLERESLLNEMQKYVLELKESEENLVAAKENTVSVENTITTFKQKTKDIEKQREELLLSKVKCNEEITSIKAKSEAAKQIILEKEEDSLSLRNNFDKEHEKVYEKLRKIHMDMKMKWKEISARFDK